MPASPAKPPARPAPKPAAESLDAFRRRESVRQGVTRLGRRMVSVALRHIEHPKNADRTEDIHQVRVQCKRIRALLRLMRPVTDTVAAKRENGRLRDISHSLADFRDAYVATETLKRIFEDAAPRQMHDAAKLLGVKKSPPKSAKSIDVVMQESAEALRRTYRALDKLPFSARGWLALAPGLKRSYRRARAAYRDCEKRGPSHLGHAFHAWRISVKDLSYQIHLLVNVGNGDMHQFSKKLQQLAKLLGTDHDYIVFDQRVREREQHYEDLANFAPVRKRLRRRLKKLRAREFALAAPLFADKPRIWITRLAGWWKVWKNPSAAVPTLIIETPLPPAKAIVSNTQSN